MALKIVVHRGRRAGHEQPLDSAGDVLVVGSAADAHLRLEDEGVLPNHLRIFRDEGRLLAMDVSGAGVLVNGKPEIQAELRAGDELALGKAVLKVTLVGAGAELRILKGPDEGKSFPVADRAVLGRGVSASIALLDMKCSREHCAVERRDGAYFLIDLGSTNGTRLNEIKLDPRSVTKLRAGDKLRLGGTLVEFRAAPAATGPKEAGVPPSRGVPSGLPGLPRAQPRATPEPRPSSAVFEIDLDLTPGPAVPVAADDGLRRGQVTQRFVPGNVFGKRPAPQAEGSSATLEGELEKMGFAQVVQFLNVSQKSGELVIRSGPDEVGIAFVEGNVRDAWGLPGSPTECFYSIARVRRGRFEFRENRPRREERIKQGTLALLMEAMRLVDEATDPGD